MAKPLKVAVIGGGCASMTAAWVLSHPERKGRYEVTVYQEGWRLGGKGASGRGPSGRIEEHGLHIWLGFYDNAFRLMRDCYAELQAAGDTRFGDWREAWLPDADIGLVSPDEDGGWQRWMAHFAPRPGLPGDDLPHEEIVSLPRYVARLIDLLGTLLLDTRVERRKSDGTVVSNHSPQADGGGPGAWLRYGAFAAAASVAESLAALASTIGSSALPPDGGLLDSVERLCRSLRAEIETRWLADAAHRHVWEIADLTLATVLGVFRHGLLWDPRGLDAIEDYECRAWLMMHGASERSVCSPYLRGLYDLSMGYLDGDPSKPSLSAGQGIRGVLRTFFGYRGAIMWRMRAGMGDVVFAPLYIALRSRGVRFQFFHRLTNVELQEGGEIDPQSGARVRSLHFDVQARIKDGQPYEPLTDFASQQVSLDRPPNEADRRPWWPSEPLWDQLAHGETMKAQARDFESFWDRGREDALTLKVGEHFDLVVLGVGLGVIPHVCSELLARDSRWLRMTQEVRTVASQSFQIWLTEDLDQLGWTGPPYITGAFAKPFDTWCDMAHVVPEEAWETPPRASVYFCGALPDEATALDDDPAYPKRRREEVRRNAIDFLAWPLPVCWPGAYDEHGDFRWEVLASPEFPSGAPPAGKERFSTQYWRANVNPSDRYVIHTPGSFRYRISPLDSTYENLTVAGDWTASGFESGCVEGAVMSGLLAAHSLCGEPRIEDIIAYDHP
jgi:uncharacterized protein with NAD-binding domain and iron-sulfur cluster